MSLKENEDCWTMNNRTITDKYAVLVNFSPAFPSEKDSCSVQISNPWAIDMQHGFGVFLTRPVDCSSMITVECLPDDSLSQRMKANLSAVQYTCRTTSYKAEMPCNLIRLTYRRDKNMKESTNPMDMQVVALAKEPCTYGEILFQCPDDYHHSCLNQILRCNGRSECPSGDDERDCHPPSPAGISIIVIVLVVLAFLILICILSTVLVCCCCRVAFSAIIHRFWPTKKNKSIEKGEIAVVVGEDAGLMKGLATPSVITALPQHHTEPATLVIDSTKPVYPRLP